MEQGLFDPKGVERDIVIYYLCLLSFERSLLFLWWYRAATDSTRLWNIIYRREPRPGNQCLAICCGINMHQQDFPKIAVTPRNVWCAPEVDQIDTKRDTSGTFSDQISVHFGSPSKNVLKSDPKVPGLSHLGPIGPTLAPNLTSIVTPVSGSSQLCSHPQTFIPTTRTLTRVEKYNAICSYIVFYTVSQSYSVLEQGFGWQKASGRDTSKQNVVGNVPLSCLVIYTAK